MRAHNIATVILLAFLLPSCSGKKRDASSQAPPARAVADAQSTPFGGTNDDGRSQLIETAAARADSLQRTSGARVQLFARTKENGPLLPVKDTLSWPDNVVESFALVRDETGRVLLLRETPFSESGDWDNEYTHYFDEKGSTILFERYSAFFNGCPNGLAKETTRHLYAPGHRLIKQTYRLENGKGEAVDSTECEFMYRYPYAEYSTWDSAAAALGLRRTE